MTAVGILAGITALLRDVQVPVFVISTYDTDWILVDKERFGTAKEALIKAGHTFKDIPI
jgi:hypothetical protein